MSSGKVSELINTNINRHKECRKESMAIAIIVAVIVLIVVTMYNSLIRKKNQVDNAFASIDVMLKQRFDLIPNLVASVQQYAKHEVDTFSAITEMRNKSYSSLSENEKADFDKNFSGIRSKFFAVAENYPELKASENFLQLQRALNEAEEQLAAARRTFNACVTDYNNAVQSFPTNVLAGMMGFTGKTVLTIPEAERATPDVKNLFNS